MARKYIWIILIVALLIGSACVMPIEGIMNDTINRPLLEGELSGEQLKAFLAAYKDFNSGIISKKLENYTVFIKDMSKGYEVIFVPKLLKSEAGLKGGSSALGQTVQYEVSKDTYQIAKKSYAR